MACKHYYNGNWYTEEELFNLPDFKTHYQERDMTNNNTGENTEGLINLFAPSGSTGMFVKFVQFKKGQLAEYRRRLREIEKEKKMKGTTPQRLKELAKMEKDITFQIEGKFELGIKGLVDEINELNNLADILAVGYYINKDLARLSNLAGSSNIDDLSEAQRIIDFYDLAGTFQRGVENPFFSQDEIFLEDQNGQLTSQYKLADNIMNQFKQWRDDAIGFQNAVNKTKEDTTVRIINSDPAFLKTYGSNNQMSFKDIINDELGLKDTDWVSMWTMDITQGIFSKNGIIPQVMFSYLSNSLETKLGWARKIEEKIDKMSPEVEKELRRLGHTLRGAGILGIRGASYQLFKEITKEGNETGGLVQRFVKEFFDAQARVMREFRDSFDSAKLNTDYTTRAKAFNTAFEELKKWRRNNTIIIDPTRVPELTSSTPATEAYKQSLISILGQKGYDEHVAKQ